MLLSRRLNGLVLRTPLYNMSSQQVPVQMLSHHGVGERLHGFLGLVSDGLLKCSHLCRGLVRINHVGSYDLGLPQLVLE